MLSYGQGGTIKGAINLPAQSLYNSLPTLLNLCQSAKVGVVIFYCGKSSSDSCLGDRGAKLPQARPEVEVHARLDGLMISSKIVKLQEFEVSYSWTVYLAGRVLAKSIPI